MNCTFTVCIVLLLASQTCANDKSTKDEGNEWSFKDYAFVAAMGGISALAVIRFGLTQLGFTAAGVAANSIAALLQSVVYGGAVAATSIFAVLQSIGAVGFSSRAGLVVFMAGAGIALWFMYPRQ